MNVVANIYHCFTNTAYYHFIVMENIYIELPRGKPKIADINNTKYRVGDILYGNCTSFNSRPAANLTWLINNKTVSMVLAYTYLLTYYLSSFIIYYTHF